MVIMQQKQIHFFRTEWHTKFEKKFESACRKAEIRTDLFRFIEPDNVYL